MRKLLYATAALALIGASAAHADEIRQRSNAGAVAGGVTGAAAGAVIGGPVGAAVGGVAGAAIGAASAVPRDVRTYVVEHPVDSVRVEGDLREGYEIPDTVTIHEIPDNPRFGYVYIDDRPVVVRMHSREVVYEGDGDTTRSETTIVKHKHVADVNDAGTDSGVTASVNGAPPDSVITYVEHHRVEPVEIDGHVRMGYVVPDTVELTPVPDDPDYAYTYVDHGPVLVRRDTRRVIWMR